MVGRSKKFTLTRVAGVNPEPFTVRLKDAGTWPAINGVGTPVTLFKSGGPVPIKNVSGEESTKSPDGPRFLTRTSTLPVVTSNDGLTLAVRNVGLLTVVGV